MPRRSFRDRFFTPPVARAITSPSGILLAGATVSAGILVGLPVVGVVAVGAAAFAARVAVAIPHDKNRERIDPFALQDPWRRFVKEALDAQKRFNTAVHDAPAGPMHERLTEIAARIDDGLDDCWRVARHGHALSKAHKRLDADEAARDLEQITSSSSSPPAEGSALAETVEALRGQVSAAQRMDQTINEARDKLRLIDARLDEAAARAIELSVTDGNVSELTTLSDDVDGLVGDLEALRQGMEETARPAPGTA
jgi:outer membrane murein-binding lipoprotein Lpp